jgi:hypothetical protein
MRYEFSKFIAFSVQKSENGYDLHMTDSGWLIPVRLGDLFSALWSRSCDPGEKGKWKKKK